MAWNHRLENACKAQRETRERIQNAPKHALESIENKKHRNGTQKLIQNASRTHRARTVIIGMEHTFEAHRISVENMLHEHGKRQYRRTLELHPKIHRKLIEIIACR